MLTACYGNCISNSGRITAQGMRPAAQTDTPVTVQTQGCLGNAGNRRHIGQITYPALTVSIIPRGKHAPVGGKSYGVKFTCGNRRDVLPRIHVALSALIISRGHAGAVTQKSHGMTNAAGDLGNVFPRLGVAPPVGRLTNGKHPSV
jgi:hypothetical protein